MIFPFHLSLIHIILYIQHSITHTSVMLTRPLQFPGGVWCLHLSSASFVNPMAEAGGRRQKQTDELDHQPNNSKCLSLSLGVLSGSHHLCEFTNHTEQQHPCLFHLSQLIRQPQIYSFFFNVVNNTVCVVVYALHQRMIKKRTGTVFLVTFCFCYFFIWKVLYISFTHFRWDHINLTFSSCYFQMQEMTWCYGLYLKIIWILWISTTKTSWICKMEQ